MKSVASVIESAGHGVTTALALPGKDHGLPVVTVYAVTECQDAAAFSLPNLRSKP